MTVYEVTNEDLTQLGGPMGTEHTTICWRKLVKTLGQAKRIAQRDYRKPIEWKYDIFKDQWTSGDLYSVMYTIKRIKL